MTAPPARNYSEHAIGGPPRLVGGPFGPPRRAALSAPTSRPGRPPGVQLSCSGPDNVAFCCVGWANRQSNLLRRRNRTNVIRPGLGRPSSTSRAVVPQPGGYSPSRAVLVLAALELRHPCRVSRLASCSPGGLHAATESGHPCPPVEPFGHSHVLRPTTPPEACL